MKNGKNKLKTDLKQYLNLYIYFIYIIHIKWMFQNCKIFENTIYEIKNSLNED